MCLGYGYRKKKNVRWVIKRKFMLHLASVRYILYVNRKMRNPKTTRKMSDFRIFCELLAKMMLKAIDFTDVVEVYRRNEKPETLGIATILLSNTLLVL